MQLVAERCGRGSPHVLGRVIQARHNAGPVQLPTPHRVHGRLAHVGVVVAEEVDDASRHAAVLGDRRADGIQRAARRGGVAVEELREDVGKGDRRT